MGPARTVRKDSHAREFRVQGAEADPARNREQGVEWNGRILISAQFLKDMGCLDRDRLRINGIERCELRYTSLTAMD